MGDGPGGDVADSCCRKEAGAGPSAPRNVNVVFLGPCGGGKSTAAGRLIADSGAIDALALKRIAREASERGCAELRYAWILDKLREERERGTTMHMGLWRLVLGGSRFTLIDAPGHEDFAKDTVTAVSQADLAVLVLPAAAPSQDAAESPSECQRLRSLAREYILLTYTLGVRRLLVCITKMDSVVGFSRERFEAAETVLRGELGQAGYQDVPILPTSGRGGDNVVRRSDEMPWYSGATLSEALRGAASEEPARPLRVPLQEVMQIGGIGVVAVGRVETGTLSPGMRLVFAPGGVRVRVLSLEMHHEPLQEARRGDSVSIRVDVAMKDLRRGMVGAMEGENAACECSSFEAQIIVLSHPSTGPIEADGSFMLECHTAQLPCSIVELVSRVDRRTGKVVVLRPKTLHTGDTAVVRVRPQGRMSLETFHEYPPLGRFALREPNSRGVTVAIGVVQRVEVLERTRSSERSVTPEAAPRPLNREARRLAGPGSSHAHKAGPGSKASGRAAAPSPFGSSPFAMFGTAHPKRAPGNFVRAGAGGAPSRHCGAAGSGHSGGGSRSRGESASE